MKGKDSMQWWCKLRPSDESNSEAVLWGGGCSVH